MPLARHRHTLSVFLFSVALAAGACTSRDDTDSQTHWLDRCQDDSSCGGGLICRCNVCVQACDAAAGASCQVGVSLGVCVGAQARATQELCGVGPGAAGLCLPGCQADADCGADRQCVEGACVPTRRWPASEMTPDMALDMTLDMTPADMSAGGEEMGGGADMPREMEGQQGEEMGDAPDQQACVKPTCPGGEVAVATSDALSPCERWSCVPEGVEVACGETLTCAVGTSYCQSALQGPPPMNNDSGITYNCQEVPPECLDDQSCECLLDIVGGPEVLGCSVAPEGMMYVELALP